MTEESASKRCPWCGDNCPRWGLDTCPLRPRQLPRTETKAPWTPSQRSRAGHNELPMYFFGRKGKILRLIKGPDGRWSSEEPRPISPVLATTDFASLEKAVAMKQVLAPCGHPGERVVGDYVRCPRCDAMPNREQLDPSRHLLCPACRTLDVVQLAPRGNRPWWKCNQCKLEFEPTRGNQP